LVSGPTRGVEEGRLADKTVVSIFLFCPMENVPAQFPTWSSTCQKADLFS